MDFNLLMHILNGISGIAALMAQFYVYKYHGSNLNPWPKNLRIFVFYFCFHGSCLLALICIIVSIIAVATNNSRPLGYHIFRLLLSVICQQLRFSYLFTTMERMVATIFLEKYAKISTPTRFFGTYIILSIIVQILCNLSSILIFFQVIPNILSGGYDNIIWIAFFIHTMTLISCKFLYDKNQKMYKLLAYQVTLQQRHQIVENIKILSTLWPTILVFSVISPIGPAATFVFTFTTNNIGPVGLFHITYNFTPVLIAIWCKFNPQRKSGAVIPTDSVTQEMELVKNPFGAILPTHVSQEKYFKDLQNLWN